MTWGRIEARSYDEAVELLEKLSQHPSALIEDTERRWSIYVSAQASEFPTVIRSAGVDPERVEIVDPPLPFVVPAPGDDVASGRD